MSEKVTFGELIESIAEETDHSQQFTHDFLKDFVDIINDGLEDDGKVNIAGFGKFELQRVDEREGYNPQTEEKITIPAHNKVVFKPYKDLRELVNAPYAHMEPQLIEDEETETSDEVHSSAQKQATDSKTEETDFEDEKSSSEETEHSEEEKKSDPATPEKPEEQELNEDDFIPTAPPTSHEQNQDEPDGEDQVEAEQESPFYFGEQPDKDNEKNQSEAATESSGDQEEDGGNGDIVEFNATQSDAEDDLLEEFIGSEEKEEHDEPSEDLTDTEEEQLEPEKNEPHETEDEPAEPVSSEQNDEEQPTGKSEEEVLAEEVKKLEETAEYLKQYQPDPSDQEDKGTPLPIADASRPTDRNSSFSYVAAAVIILLLIAGGAWYYSTLSTNDTPLISSSEEQTVATNATKSQNNNDQQQTADQQGAKDAQSATKNQSQATTQSSATTAQSTNNVTSSNQAVEIEEGQTLWSLAEDRYGNPRLWPWIYGNNGSLEDPDLIYAGSSLSVPLPSGPKNTLTNTDSVGVAKGYIATYKWYKSNGEPKAKNHLWAAKLYHDNLQQLATVPIDETDLSYANRAR